MSSIGARVPVLVLTACQFTVAVAVAQPGHSPIDVSSDGCIPYWELVDLECNQSVIAAKGLANGPYCDPVHERVTRSALRVLHIGKDSATDPVVSEYLRGVRWSDDPEGALEAPSGSPSNGLRWCRAFQKAQADALAHRQARSLLARSHFGDLQLLHSMASKPGRTSIETFHEIEPWLEFSYSVAIGTIPGSARLYEVKVPQLGAKFPALRRQTVDALFGVVNGHGDVKARALGTFLHFLQDSLGDGHAARSNGGGRPPITHYFTYAGVADPGHKADTGWRAAWGDDASLKDWPGAIRAVQVSIDLLRLAQQKRPWPDVKKMIELTSTSYSAFNAKAVRWQQ